MARSGGDKFLKPRAQLISFHMLVFPLLIFLIFGVLVQWRFRARSRALAHSYPTHSSTPDGMYMPTCHPPQVCAYVTF